MNSFRKPYTAVIEGSSRRHHYHYCSKECMVERPPTGSVGTAKSHKVAPVALAAIDV